MKKCLKLISAFLIALFIIQLSACGFAGRDVEPATRSDEHTQSEEDGPVTGIICLRGLQEDITMLEQCIIKLTLPSKYEISLNVNGVYLMYDGTLSENNDEYVMYLEKTNQDLGVGSIVLRKDLNGTYTLNSRDGNSIATVPNGCKFIEMTEKEYDKIKYMHAKWSVQYYDGVVMDND